jgi:hypothetical protein
MVAIASAFGATRVLRKMAAAGRMVTDPIFVPTLHRTSRQDALQYLCWYSLALAMVVSLIPSYCKAPRMRVCIKSTASSSRFSLNASKAFRFRTISKFLSESRRKFILSNTARALREPSQYPAGTAIARRKLRVMVSVLRKFIAHLSVRGA